MRFLHMTIGIPVGTLLLITAGLGVAQTPAKEPAQPPSLETKVLSKIHQTNQTEVPVGKLAQEKGHSEKVRKYGDRLVRDHQSADKKVTALAQREGITLIQPKPETAEEKEQTEQQKQAMEKLQQLSGEEFDRAFLKIMEEGHEKKIQMLSEALPKLKDRQVHDLVEKLIPILQEHHDLAKNLSRGSGK